jgi:hypothetical protein
MTSSHDPELLNAAMRSYVHTFSRQDLLDAFLAEKGLEDQRQGIKSHLDSLLKTAEDHLYDYPGGVPWDSAFEQSYLMLLRQSHPWIDSTSIERVLSFSRWLCWHEGLNRNPKA